MKETDFLIRTAWRHAMEAAVEVLSSRGHELSEEDIAALCECGPDPEDFMGVYQSAWINS